MLNISFLRRLVHDCGRGRCYEDCNEHISTADLCTSKVFALALDSSTYICGFASVIL